jgi:hypothetical protein
MRATDLATPYPAVTLGTQVAAVPGLATVMAAAGRPLAAFVGRGGRRRGALTMDARPGRLLQS